LRCLLSEASWPHTSFRVGENPNATFCGDSPSPRSSSGSRRKRSFPTHGGGGPFCCSVAGFSARHFRGLCFSLQKVLIDAGRFRVGSSFLTSANQNRRLLLPRQGIKLPSAEDCSMIPFFFWKKPLFSRMLPQIASSPMSTGLSLLFSLPNPFQGPTPPLRTLPLFPLVFSAGIPFSVEYSRSSSPSPLAKNRLSCLNFRMTVSAPDSTGDDVLFLPSPFCQLFFLQAAVIIGLEMSCVTTLSLLLFLSRLLEMPVHTMGTLLFPFQKEANLTSLSISSTPRWQKWRI